jgi:hypothetical protein
MPANTEPIFVLTPRIAVVRISTANTNRDGTGTLGDVITGGTNGTRVDRIVIKATSTTTAGMVRLYLYDGTNTRLWDEVIVLAITPSGTVVSFKTVQQSPDLMSPLVVLASGQKIQASTHNAESFDVTAFGGDF